jgi:hypothetical protein
VLFGDRIAFQQGKVPDRKPFRGCAHQLGGRGLATVRGSDIAVQDGRHSRHRRRGVAIVQGLGVLERERIRIADRIVHRAAEHEEQVGTDPADRAGDGLLGAAADRQHGDHGGYADDDPEHGQPGAQLVRIEAFEGLHQHLG